VITSKQQQQTVSNGRRSKREEGKNDVENKGTQGLATLLEEAPSVKGFGQAEEDQ